VTLVFVFWRMVTSLAIIVIDGGRGVESMRIDGIGYIMGEIVVRLMLMVICMTPSSISEAATDNVVI